MYRLHATIFQGYRDWCRHVDLPERIKELALEELRKGGEAVVRASAAGLVRPCVWPPGMLPGGGRLLRPSPTVLLLCYSAASAWQRARP